jgi:hypothetical protein
MARRLPLILAAAGLWLLCGGPAAAVAAAVPAELTVADLLADPEAHSGAAVVIRGELVGDFGRRDDGTVWTQLNDDPYVEAPLLAGGSLAGANLGIGVRIPAELWPGLTDPGGYRVRGPVVALAGIWRYHDPERGGETYLDVTALEVLADPLPLDEGADWLPLGLGLGLLAAAGAVAGTIRRRRAD